MAQSSDEVCIIFNYAININGAHWIDALFDGTKTVETRKYRIPPPMKNTRCLIIQTGLPQAVPVGWIVFNECKQYQNANEFYRDDDKHLIYRNDNNSVDFQWDNGPKWGWIVSKVHKFDENYCLVDRHARRISRNVAIKCVNE